MKSLATAGKSWRTTALGVISGLLLVLPELAKLIDGDAATGPDWNIAVGGLMVALFGVNARDNVVSSEGAGAK